MNDPKWNPRVTWSAGCTTTVDGALAVSVGLVAPSSVTTVGVEVWVWSVMQTTYPNEHAAKPLEVPVARTPSVKRYGVAHT